MFVKLRKATISFAMSVRPHGTTRFVLGEFGVSSFFENMSIQFKFHYNWEKIKDTLREDQSTFSITSRSFLLRMKSISDKICKENRYPHFTFNEFFF
jgi:hypothetical protein